MSDYIITPGSKIEGIVKISGSKNASLPILAAGLMSDGISVFDGIPKLSDTENMAELLRSVDAECTRKPDESISISFAQSSKKRTADSELVNKLRASFLIMGPMLARTGRIRIPLPGGCQIGARPIDLHLKGFAAMGAKIKRCGNIP